MSDTTPNVPPKKKGMSRLVAAAGYSVAGLRSAFASEEAFRLEVVGLVVLTPLALVFLKMALGGHLHGQPQLVVIEGF